MPDQTSAHILELSVSLQWNRAAMVLNSGINKILCALEMIAVFCYRFYFSVRSLSVCLSFGVLFFVCCCNMFFLLFVQQGLKCFFNFDFLLPQLLNTQALKVKTTQPRMTRSRVSQWNTEPYCTITVLVYIRWAATKLTTTTTDRNEFVSATPPLW